jgi:LytS/YehU family sensor histidine kinase
MDLSMGTVMTGLILGLLGMVMFMKGRRDSEPLVLLGGLLISAVPMVVHTLWLDWTLAGAVLAAIVLLRRDG